MRIICNLPNAGDLINGIKFIAHEAGKISEEIADDFTKGIASVMLTIPGFSLHEAEPAAPAPAITPAQASGTTVVEVELDTLRAKLAADAAAEDAAVVPAADVPAAPVEEVPVDGVADATDATDATDAPARAKRAAKAAAAE